MAHETDEILAKKLSSFVHSYLDLLNEKGIRRVTFLIFSEHSYPKYFTFRSRNKVGVIRLFGNLFTGCGLSVCRGHYLSSPGARPGLPARDKPPQQLCHTTNTHREPQAPPLPRVGQGTDTVQYGLLANRSLCL